MTNYLSWAVLLLKDRASFLQVAILISRWLSGLGQERFSFKLRYQLFSYFNKRLFPSVLEKYWNNEYLYQECTWNDADKSKLVRTSLRHYLISIHSMGRSSGNYSFNKLSKTRRGSNNRLFWGCQRLLSCDIRYYSAKNKIYDVIKVLEEDHYTYPLLLNEGSSLQSSVYLMSSRPLLLKLEQLGKVDRLLIQIEERAGIHWQIQPLLVALAVLAVMMLGL